MIGSPPSETGATKDTSAVVALVAIAVTEVGESGSVEHPVEIHVIPVSPADERSPAFKTSPQYWYEINAEAPSKALLPIDVIPLPISKEFSELA